MELNSVLAFVCVVVVVVDDDDDDDDDDGTLKPNDLK